MRRRGPEALSGSFGTRFRARLPMSAVAAGVALALAACDVSRPIRPSAPACAPFPTEVSVSTDCEVGRPRVTVRQDECSVALFVDGLDHVVLRGQVQPDGRLALEPDPARGCSAIEPRREALLSVACDACGYDFNDPTIPLALEEVVRVAVVDQPFRPPTRVTTRGESAYVGLNPRAGYLTAMVVLPDVAWVATASGAFGKLDCDGDEPSELVPIIDGVAGAPRPAPPCLVALAPDPIDPQGFLGATGGPRARIHRFAPSGALLASVDGPPLVSRTPGEDILVVGFVADDVTTSNPRLGLALTTRRKLHEAWLVMLDPSTLATTRVSQPASNPIRAITPILRRRAFAADDTTGAVVPFRVEDDVVEPAFTLNVTGGPTDDAGAIGIHPSSGTMIVATTDTESVAYFIDERGSPAVTGFARYVERDAAPWAMAAWPRVDAQMAVGVAERAPPYRAYLTRLLVPERRYLPGSAELGQGVVGAISVDGTGRLWVMLPWSGEVLRITVR